MIFTKEDIGREIYAIPTGNNARGCADKIVTFRVISVGRIYVSLSMIYPDGTAGYEDKYHPNNGATQKSINAGYTSNSGYKFFKTLDDLADFRELKSLQSLLDERLWVFRSGNLNKSQIERIIDILRGTDK